TKLNNKLELIQEFIKDRMQEVERCSVSSSEAHKLANLISKLMMQSCRLTVSESLLPVEMPKQLKALISVGLLNRQNGQISFRHQVLFDYQIGFSLYQTAMLSVENLLDAIGSREEQTLMKREQLKYAMNLLLQMNQESFCNCVNAILFTDDIRFHLKHLVLYCIKDILVYPTGIEPVISGFGNRTAIEILQNMNPEVVNPWNLKIGMILKYKKKEP
ncbi:Sec23/Sec24 trunk domain protein, partial [Snodgrassella alvi SCGC AB-598-O11]